MKKNLFTLVAMFSLMAQSIGQTDPTLFTVNGKPVTVSEFNYIYTKTNGAKADFSKSSVMEYLDLYTKFKMKVARAKEMQLDTIPSLQEELAGYRRQLADSYLTDREVTDKLIREGYDRMQKDVKISHILVTINPKDTTAAWAKIQSIYKELKGGASFESLVAKSEDKNTNQNGGSIGYLTALLPDGFYSLENAMYQIPVGKTSEVIRTPMGYHIIKINDVRPARGEMEAAHILIRKKKLGVDQPNAKTRIDSLYTLLKAQANFDDLSVRFSEDENSANKEGYLGVFGIGRYEPVFEDAAFGIETDGGISAPVESSIGWHIIKRRERKGILPFDALKTRLKAQIQREQRYELARSSMVERIKKQSGMVEATTVRDGFINTLDSSFLTYAWRQPVMNAEKIVNFGKEKSYTTTDFSDFLAEKSNMRVSYASQMNNSIKAVASQLYTEFLNDKALAYEETQLDKKYPDFRNLMREYEEGILLFEAIKQNVWDKASQDSVGLEKFYADNKNRYQWEERGSVIAYMVNDTLKPVMAKIKKFAAKNDAQKVLKKFNAKGEYIRFQEYTNERSKIKGFEGANWKTGTIIDGAGTMSTFRRLDKILPKGTKSLKEARGYVVADYQEFLEKQWMEDLAKRYKVETNEAVLNTLIKK
ncbi:MAG: peptidylprolyl isomerase [Saprospiraceae bacterium]|nr:peptidylprolyl isomerase [Saprospiraceae bacterium]